jgi:hypothetical protein
MARTKGKTPATDQAAIASEIVDAETDTDMLPGEDSRAWARRKSTRMFKILESIAEDGKNPAPSRVSAAQTIIEHGHGKASAQPVEPGSSGPDAAQHKPDLASLRDRAIAPGSSDPAPHANGLDSHS